MPKTEIREYEVKVTQLEQAVLEAALDAPIRDYLIKKVPMMEENATVEEILEAWDRVTEKMRDAWDDGMRVRE